ncbi:MAG: hypothetical protein K2M23_03210 [Alphaproteobacteria bacterium]|nr:hypothetical protein [Alphaproteobacteria bacterium]
MKLNKSYILALGVLGSPLLTTNSNAQTFYQCMPITCSDGQYINGNKCENCPDGYYCPNGKDKKACSAEVTLNCVLTYCSNAGNLLTNGNGKTVTVQGTMNSGSFTCPTYSGKVGAKCTNVENREFENSSSGYVQITSKKFINNGKTGSMASVKCNSITGEITSVDVW